MTKCHGSVERGRERAKGWEKHNCRMARFCETTVLTTHVVSERTVEVALEAHIKYKSLGILPSLIRTFTPISLLFFFRYWNVFFLLFFLLIWIVFFLLLLFCCLQFFLIRFWCCDGETCSILSQKLLKLLVYTRRHLRSKFIANLVNSGVELLLQHIYFWSGRKFRPFNNQTNMDEKEWVCLRLSVRMKERKGNEIKAYAHTRMNDKQNSQNKN